MYGVVYLSCARHLTFAQPREYDRGDNQDADEAAYHAPDHGCGERFHHFGAGAVAPQNGQQPGYDGRNGHDLGIITHTNFTIRTCYI